MDKVEPSGQTQHDSKDRFILRFHSDGQRAAMKARAFANKRSMNAEILVLIEQGLASVGLHAVRDQK